MKSINERRFQLSVIIPVYNAGNYVKRAVESALQQPETDEVILIEDKSTDNSLQMCKMLDKQYKKVKLYQHPDKRNCGAAVSRNLGVEKAKYDYIAFLDADDFYLTNRFSHVKGIFSSDTYIDGVYDAIGTHFESENAKEFWLKNSNMELLTTLTKKVEAEKLFVYLARWTHGHFSLDGLTVKKEAFRKAGLFDTELRLHQDTALCIKLSAVSRLVPGQIKKPVAMRGVHDSNRTASKDTDFHYTKYMLWKTLYHWTKQIKLEKKKSIIILNNYCKAKKSLYKKERHFFLAFYYFAIVKLLSVFINILYHKYNKD